MKLPKVDPSGRNVLILAAPHAGEEGICLGLSPAGKWAVLPHCSREIVYLELARQFSVLAKSHDRTGMPLIYRDRPSPDHRALRACEPALSAYAA